VREHKERSGRVRTLAVPAIRVVVGLATGDNSTDTVDEGVENLGTRSGQPKVRVLRARVSPSRYQSNN